MPLGLRQMRSRSKAGANTLCGRFQRSRRTNWSMDPLWASMHSMSCARWGSLQRTRPHRSHWRGVHAPAPRAYQQGKADC